MRVGVEEGTLRGVLVAVSDGTAKAARDSTIVGVRVLVRIGIGVEKGATEGGNVGWTMEQLMSQIPARQSRTGTRIASR
jgi:hypothetical protein